jgi:hypothetical protein
VGTVARSLYVQPRSAGHSASHSVGTVARSLYVQRKKERSDMKIRILSFWYMILRDVITSRRFEVTFSFVFKSLQVPEFTYSSRVNRSSKLFY